MKRSRKNIRVTWQPYFQRWVATDLDRPGCVVADTNKTRLWRELREAQDGWDQRAKIVQAELDRIHGH